MTPMQALSLLYATKDWSAFLVTASRVRIAVNQQCLEDLRPQNLEEVSESFLDTTYDL